MVIDSLSYFKLSDIQSHFILARLRMQSRGVRRRLLAQHVL
jgi:hypothetical protein